MILLSYWAAALYNNQRNRSRLSNWFDCFCVIIQFFCKPELRLNFVNLGFFCFKKIVPALPFIINSPALSFPSCKQAWRQGPCYLFSRKSCAKSIWISSKKVCCDRYRLKIQKDPKLGERLFFKTCYNHARTVRRTDRISKYFEITVNFIASDGKTQKCTKFMRFIHLLHSCKPYLLFPSCYVWNFIDLGNRKCTAQDEDFFTLWQSGLNQSAWAWTKIPNNPHLPCCILQWKL